MSGGSARLNGRAVSARRSSASQTCTDPRPSVSASHSLRATGLSGGEAKMLSVAKELVTDPKLLLVDEPSAGLAPVLSNHLYARLLEERGVFDP